MKLQNLLKYVAVFISIVSLMSLFVAGDDEDGIPKQRRRRRRQRNLVRRQGPRRIRHTGGSKRRMEFVRRRLTNYRARRRRPQDGKLRLVDGRADFEGNVEIFHEGKWGNICDDEWDLREGEIVCRELGFIDAIKVTYNGHFGHVRHEYWMDNLFCSGEEKRLKDCRQDGWGRHDCERNEAAGVVCQIESTTTTQSPVTTQAVPKDAPKPVKKGIIQSFQGGKLKVRLRGGRLKNEGRVEVKPKGTNSWGLLCGDDWSLLEAMVVCRQLGLQFAQSAPSTGYFGGNSTDIILSGVKCHGDENSLSKCLHDVIKEVDCPGPYPNANIAGVTCVDKMADLAPDHLELARSAHLEDKQLFFLQCAIEENCLASAAYKQMENGYGWHLETRRLLRFTARIVNQGDDDFIPALPKNHWEWHQCHMHYHSMEVFAHYDITDAQGNRVAEGHKASFCLEDNNCVPGVTPKYKCENFGDQGISPGCTDTYAYNIDCQWIDVTEVPAGTYTFKLEINPEFKIGEQSFDNNAAVCELIYSEQSAWLGNCALTRPGTKIDKEQLYQQETKEANQSQFTVSFKKNNVTSRNSKDSFSSNGILEPSAVIASLMSDNLTQIDDETIFNLTTTAEPSTENSTSFQELEIIQPELTGDNETTSDFGSFEIFGNFSILPLNEEIQNSKEEITNFTSTKRLTDNSTMYLDY